MTRERMVKDFMRREGFTTITVSQDEGTLEQCDICHRKLMVHDAVGHCIEDNSTLAGYLLCSDCAYCLGYE